MKLIVILICLGVERFWSPIQNLRHWHWFDSYVEWLHETLKGKSFLNGPAGVVLAIAPISIVVGWLQQSFSGGWWEIFGLIFAVLVLVMSMGPKDLGADVVAYLDARRRGDDLAERLCAEDIVGAKLPDEFINRTWIIIANILGGAHHWIFGVLFWFMILGPVGAVIYRLAYQLSSHAERYAVETPGFSNAALNLIYLLAWLPARVAAFGYAITGSFIDAMRYWRKHASSTTVADDEFLAATGLGALRLDSADVLPTDANVREAMDLVRRAIFLWLTVIALMTLAGWW